LWPCCIMTSFLALADAGGLHPLPPQGLFQHVSGAEEACPHCWPWRAALQLLGDYQYDGAVTSPAWLLTAAHCVQLCLHVDVGRPSRGRDRGGQRGEEHVACHR
uniref:Peptidase S1 domain-containing protein n=1 Tax=Calidris pygmaea TaxID=425635 RepID=A0A8C3JUJ9_9CHAR